MRRQLAYPCHTRSEAQLIIQTRQKRDPNIDFFHCRVYTSSEPYICLPFVNKKSLSEKYSLHKN